MDKGKLIRILGWVLIIILVLFSVYGLINYNLLQKEITGVVEVWGLGALGVLSFLLEGLPLIIGPDFPLFSAIAIGLDPLGIFLVLLFSTTTASLLSYLLGYSFGYELKKVVNKNNMKKYQELFDKHGKKAMIITALTPIPHIPIIAGIFKMEPLYFVFVVTGFRILRYTVTSLILMSIFGLI